MARTPVARPTSALLVGLTALLLTGPVGVPAVSEGPSSRPDDRAGWATGRAVAIAAPRGRATFGRITPKAGSRTLVIVSILARVAGPFPVRLVARRVDPGKVRPPAVEPEGPRHAPDLRAPVLAPIAPPVDRLPARERVFHIMVRDGDVASPSNYRVVKGTLRAVGRRVQVYVDHDDVSVVNQDLLRDLIATFDESVFPVAARTIGQARDVDGDGRFTVLMSGWLAHLAGGRHAVDGFVRGSDFARGLPAPFSNRCDMMYVSTSLAPGTHLRTVLAHEYTHAVTVSTKTFPAPGTRAPGLDEEGWLDEALAHLVEDLHGFSRSNLDYRVSAFLSQPERYRLVVDDYYAAELFRSHGNRGATYLFLRWCADRYGPTLLPALIGSNRRGLANLEAATGRSFADLYRDWSLAVYFDGFEPGASQAGQTRSVDLRASFDGWELAGPRTVRVKPGGPPEVWDSAGTASRYVVVESSAGGAVEVQVEASERAELQVTAVPLPDDLAEIELNVRETTSPGGEPSLLVGLAETNGTPVTLTTLAWEPLVPGPDPHTPGFRHASLDAPGIITAGGSTSVPAHGRFRPWLVPAPAGFPDVGPIVVKAVGTDARGRRVSAWADVTPGHGPSVATGHGLNGPTTTPRRE